MISKKYFISGMIIGIVLIFAFIFSLPDGKLHITFCNVGQGDAAYIRTPSNQDMLIDGGPDDKILACLGRHMPFYDRTIDMVLLTHPQKDHMQGLISVVQRYSVRYFVIGEEGNETEGYKTLVENLQKKKIPIKNLFQGDEFAFGRTKFKVLWPNREWVALHVSTPITKLSYLNNPNGQVLGLTTDANLNDFSFFLDLSYGSFSALFTGDGDRQIQPEIMKTANVPTFDILKFPHHGSKTGILPEFLDLVKPKLAIISVGKNSYGHPTKEALKLLSDRDIKLKRTDLDGDVEVISDGNNWSLVGSH